MLRLPVLACIYRAINNIHIENLHRGAGLDIRYVQRVDELLYVQGFGRLRGPA